MMKTSIFLFLFLASLQLFSETITEEDIRTPHWPWAKNHMKGTLKALFLTNNQAAREPAELAQRFDIDAITVPVTGSPYANRFDQDFFKEALKKDLDVIVLCFSNPFKDLSPESMKALREKFDSGTPIVYYAPKSVSKKAMKEDVVPALGLQLDKVAATPLDKPELIRNIPVDDLDYYLLPRPKKGGKSKKNKAAPEPEQAKSGYAADNQERPASVETYSGEGKGMFYMVPRCDVGLMYFNAFAPQAVYEKMPFPTHEFVYAAVARLLRQVTDKAASLKLAKIDIPKTAEVGKPLKLKLTLVGTAGEDATLNWALYSPYNDLLDKGTHSLRNSCDLTIPVRHPGDLIFRYQVLKGGKTTDFGAMVFHAQSGITIDDISISATNPPDKPVTVKWSVKGQCPPNSTCRVQTLDPDGNLWLDKKLSSDSTELTLRPPTIPYSSHQLRLIIENGDTCFAEKRQWFQIQLDRQDDPKHFQVIVWGNERGCPLENWRYRRLRQLGITTYGMPSRTVNPYPSRAGLRLAPINCCVPPNRFNKNWVTQERIERLNTLTEKAVDYSPLGYVLSDEPAIPEKWRFRDWAAEKIHLKDPGARVGYSGVHVDIGSNVPKLLGSVDFLQGYSPYPLYRPQMWRGIERDMLRSFVTKDSVFSCWTHYCPWLDHEAYMRSTPWLLLFDKCTGVSYFCSSYGNFSILPSDFQLTHESRWMRQELEELHQGLGDQLISMDREVGSVRIVCPVNVQGDLLKITKQQTLVWTKALNNLSIPYRFISQDECAGLDPKKVSLVFCLSATTLTKEQIDGLKRYVKQGGRVVVTPPFGGLSITETSGKPFWLCESNKQEVKSKNTYNLAENDAGDLLGFKVAKSTNVKEFVKELLKCFGVPIKINEFGKSDLIAQSKPFEAESGGLRGITLTTGRALAKFVINPDLARYAPKFIKEIWQTPAVVSNKYGEGAVITLNFAPTLENAKSLVKSLCGKFGAYPTGMAVTIDGVDAPSTYLYHLGNGSFEMTGIIQDFIENPAELKIEDKKTAAHHQHGSLRWGTRRATLELSKQCHLYNVRTGKYLGLKKSTDFDLTPGVPALFSRLPYRVSAIKVDCPKEATVGQTLKVAVELLADGNVKPTRHIVHVAVKDGKGDMYPALSRNLTIVDGRAETELPVFYNVPEYLTILVRDAVTGVQAERQVRISGTKRKRFREDLTAVEHKVELPKGEWSPNKEEVLDKVAVKIGRLKGKKVNGSWYKGSINNVRGDFSLTGRAQAYGMKYNVLHDPNLGYDDPRQIKSNSASGLGITGPRAHCWFGHGCYDIYFDDKCVSNYLISDIREVDCGQNGRIDFTWDSPYGKATLSFAMLLDDSCLFQQLTVKPTIPVKTVKVTMKSYFGDFGAGDKKPFIKTFKKTYEKAATVDPKECFWAFYADEFRDYAYGKGGGPSGIMVLPEDWNSFSFAPRNGGKTVLEKKVDLKPGESKSLRWALWIFPKTTNADAYNVLRDAVEDTKTKLIDLFNVSGASNQN